MLVKCPRALQVHEAGFCFHTPAMATGVFPPFRLVDGSLSGSAVYH